MKPRIAVQLFSVRKEMERDISGTLHAVRDLGFEGVEFYGSYIRPDVILKALDDTGLEIAGWHTPVGNIMPGLIEAAIAYNKQIGNKSMVVSWLPEETNRDAWLNAAKIFQAAGKRLAEEGMYTGYHNHQFDFKPIEGSTPWDIFAGATDSSIVLQMDTGNCMGGGGDPLASMRAYPGRARTVHLKPFSKTDRHATMIGRDDVDWPAVKEFCEGEGKTEWFIVEYETEALYAPLDGIGRCLTALKEMGF